MFWTRCNPNNLLKMYVTSGIKLVYLRKEGIIWYIELREPITPRYGSIFIFAWAQWGRQLSLLFKLGNNVGNKPIAAQLSYENDITGWNRKANFIRSECQIRCCIPALFFFNIWLKLNSSFLLTLHHMRFKCALLV